MKKLTQACRDSESPFDTNGDANFWLARRRERLSADCVLRFCRYVATVFEISGRLRPITGPKQFQQIVRCTDQLPFRAGFCDSAQQKTPDTPRGLDLAEHRLHNRFFLIL